MTARRILFATACWLVAPACFLDLISSFARAQTSSTAATSNAPAEVPAFEVASIRAVPESQRGNTSIGAYGLPRFTLKGVSLSMLISFAYDIDGSNVNGAPKGLDDAVFDIDAKSEGDVPLTYERLKPLMQQLLQQRFGMVAHKVVKQTSGYALIVAKDGPKLTPTTPQSVPMGQIMQDQLRASGMSVAEFARMLASPAQKPVIDATGIAGKYDFMLHYASPADTESTAPSLFTALKEQLGLLLKPQTVPVDTLVIEHVNKTPTDN